MLFRDKRGHLGLLAEACAHRRASLVYGIPENEGLRCAYHGWLYNVEGKCLDQPGELIRYVLRFADLPKAIKNITLFPAA